jgi:hypothetical protein
MLWWQCHCDSYMLWWQCHCDSYMLWWQCHCDSYMLWWQCHCDSYLHRYVNRQHNTYLRTAWPSLLTQMQLTCVKMSVAFWSVQTFGVLYDPRNIPVSFHMHRSSWFYSSTWLTPSCYNQCFITRATTNRSMLLYFCSTKNSCLVCWHEQLTVWLVQWCELRLCAVLICNNVYCCPWRWSPRGETCTWVESRGLTLILLTWRIGWALIMPANVRWDLIQGLKA